MLNKYLSSEPVSVYCIRVGISALIPANNMDKVPVISVYNKIECNYVAILLSCAGMRSRPFILRCAAFLLILVFSQKAGAGLFLHNLFHSTTASNKVPGQQNEKGKEFNYNCTCIDDFLMPFDGSDEPVFSQPVLAFANPNTFFEDNIPFQTSIFSSLRGPPSNWL